MGSKKIHEFDEGQMLDDYRKFDPIEFKYRILLKPDAYEMKMKLQDYESSQQFADLTKKSFWDLQKNLDMAYADKKRTDQFIELYGLFYDKIIKQYINIDGVERLFSEKYADFEWEMHLGINYKKHEMSFYRDHFIHQLKDAYMMHVMLEKGGFYRKVHDILWNPGNSKISRYVWKSVNKQLNMPHNAMHTIINDGIDIKDASNMRNDRDKPMVEFYLYNIIYMASFMAGCFHDIGYPTAADTSENRRIIDYIVESYHFEGKDLNFNHIMSLLQNSLLFRLVRPEEIRARLEGDKIDHGALSALMFLLHFYENGSIHYLEPYKVCAVELAGQEWGRIYFEVLDKTNLILCPSCKLPIMRRDGIDGISCDYKCGCRSSKFKTVFPYKEFPSRRLYNVTVCTSLKVETNEENENQYRFYLRYDLSRLLHIACLSTSYAKHILEELNKMKKLFPRQSGIDMVQMKYFVTSNILLIKAKIVRRYLQSSLKRPHEELYPDFFTDTALIPDRAGKLYQQAKNSARNLVDGLFKSQKKIGLHGYLIRAFTIYVYIAYLMEIGEANHSLKINADKKIGSDQFKELIDFLRNQEPVMLDSDIVKCLLQDCGLQASRLYGDLWEYSYYPEDYFEQFQPDGDYFYQCAEQFINMNQYQHCKEDVQYNVRVLDAFTDLHWIQKMLLA